MSAFALPPETFPSVAWGAGTASFERGEAPDADVWAVVVFVMRAGSFLLGRVPRGWCTPSGHVEAGETPACAAVREVYEEVGASVSALVRMGDFVTAEPDGGARRAAVFHARFAAAGPIPPQSESAEAAWFTMEEVRTAYWRWDALMERMFTYASTFEEGVAP